MIESLWTGSIIGLFYDLKVLGREDGRWKGEGRRQKTEDRKEKGEGRRQSFEVDYSLHPAFNYKFTETIGLVLIRIQINKIKNGNLNQLRSPLIYYFHYSYLRTNL
ncbi:MAG: hypothetical protein GQ527_04620 [Bacteroidales bacterium]|nr:hypothetical protein [Bacteroidales bacterium]